MVFAAVGCKGDPNNSGNTDVRLKAIGVTKKPTKLEYVSGEKFDPTGMVVSAQYTDSKVKVITGWDYDKKAALQEEDDLITIKYTENDVTKTCTLKITVNPGIDHVKYHEFSNGKCSCGAMMFEAEKAITSGTPTYGNETFIIDSDKASGGKCIGNWGEGDNRWTTYFTVDKEVENVVIGMKFAPTGAINQGDWQYSLPTTPEDADHSKKTGPWPFEVCLNGTIVSWQTSEVPVFGGQDYFEWTTLLTNGLTFKKGENMIEIEPLDYYGANIDYIFVNIKTDVKGEYTTKEVVPEHKHEFTEKRCECGAVKIEAEDCEVIGTPASWAGTEGFYRASESLSGGKKVGAWGVNGDNRIYIKFTSDKAYENVTMTFRLSTGGVVMSTAFDFYFNETRGTKIAHPKLSGGMGWTDIKSSAFNIKQGENFLVLEAYQGCEIDWDYFVIEGLAADSVITVTKYVPAA